MFICPSDYAGSGYVVCQNDFSGTAIHGGFFNYCMLSINEPISLILVVSILKCYLKLYDEITRLQFFIYNIVRVVPQKIYNNNILNYGRILRGAIGKDPG